MSTFLQLVEDQFVYGGKKYANSKEKEVTDILTDDFGFKGLLWCINKYVYRYRNQGREKDPLKIACYMFIIWIKFGLHKRNFVSLLKRIFSIWVNTTVDVKSRYFPLFMDLVRRISLEEVWSGDVNNRDEIISSLTLNVKRLRNPLFRTEKMLVRIFKLTEKLWEIDGFANASEHETDTSK